MYSGKIVSGNREVFVFHIAGDSKMASACKLFTTGKKAFTLIELLVVIAIIALLLSVLLPSLRKAKEATAAVVCSSSLKQWNMMAGFFLNDNKGIFPDADWNGDNSTDPHGQWWIQPFKQYMADNMDILLCRKAILHPDDVPGSDTFAPSQHTECWGSRDKVPAPTAGKWTWASYAPNAWMMDPTKGTWGAPRTDPKVFWGKFEKVTAPYQVPFFLDARWVDVWPDDTDVPRNEEWSGTSGGGYMRAVALTRHGLKTVVVFMDGSVSRTDIKDLWRLKWHRKYNLTNTYTQANAPWPAWMR